MKADKYNFDDLVRAFGLHDALEIQERQRKNAERRKRKRENRKARAEGRLTDTQQQTYERTGMLPEEFGLDNGLKRTLEEFNNKTQPKELERYDNET